MTTPFAAAAAGDIAALRGLRPDPNARDDSGRSLLMLAADYATSALLLEWGAAVNGAQNGLTALHYAVQSPEKGLDVARLLLDAGADVALGAPIVHAEPAYKALLLDFGADVNAQAADGDTALHVALRNLDLATTRLLVERGADPLHVNAQGLSAHDLLDAMLAAAEPRTRPLLEALRAVLAIRLASRAA